MPPPAEGFASRLFLGPALRTQPDRRLVSLVREGYEMAFEEIVRRYGKPLTRYAASIVGGRSEDVTQDAFSKALLALRRDDAEIDLRPWLFRIIRNTALNDLRDSPPSPEMLAGAIAGGRNPAEELERREELTDLMRRLQALPEPQRAAIVMRELEGLSHEEIAAALGLTGGGARQAIYRARQTLRDGLGMLVPLPILQAMLGGSGPAAAEAAANAAGVGSAAGAGIAVKATAATVLVAGAVGTGVAIKDNPRDGNARAASAQLAETAVRPPASEPVSVADDSSGDDRHGDDGHRGRGETGSGDDHGGHGEPEPGDDHGGESDLVDDRRGRGHGREPSDDHGGDRSGPPGRHGGGSGPDEDDRSGSSHGGSGSHGSGSGGGSGHGGSGPSGGSPSEDDSSGHGGSGSEDSGTSNSGPGSGEEPEEGAPLEADDDASGSGSGDSSDSGGGSGLSG
jgi:RNA polymerase sigma factor (sigma-70 family)